MNQFKGVTYLTEDQFRTLSDTGSLEVGGVTYTYQPNERLYVTNSNETINLNTVDENSNYYAGGATPTASDKYSIVIGPDAQSNGTGNIIYGAKAYGPGDIIGSDNTTQAATSVVIGNYAGTHASAIRSIVIGANARSEAIGAIQLGMGTNTIANSVQFFGDNIYKKDTKTLTIKNAQINDQDVYGIIKGDGAPSATTEGKIGQEYQDITNDARYYCTSAGSAYIWQEIQNKLTQSSTSMNAVTGDVTNTIRIGNLLIQSITFENVTGNTEKTWAFPITFDKLLVWNCNCEAEGQSVNNGASIISHSENSLTVRTCGATSNISLFAIGWQAD